MAESADFPAILADWQVIDCRSAAISPSFSSNIGNQAARITVAAAIFAYLRKQRYVIRQILPESWQVRGEICRASGKMRQPVTGCPAVARHSTEAAWFRTSKAFRTWQRFDITLASSRNALSESPPQLDAMDLIGGHRR